MSVLHGASSQHGHLAHGVLLEPLEGVPLGPQQLSYEVELQQERENGANKLAAMTASSKDEARRRVWGI